MVVFVLFLLGVSVGDFCASSQAPVCLVFVGAAIATYFGLSFFLLFFVFCGVWFLVLVERRFGVCALAGLGVVVVVAVVVDFRALSKAPMIIVVGDDGGVVAAVGTNTVVVSGFDTSFFFYCYFHFYWYLYC